MSAALLLLLAPAAAAAALLPDFGFESEGDGPAARRSLGRALGAGYREAIAARLAGRGRLFEFLGTAPGRRAYEAFLATHERAAPELVRELEGIAEGSGRSFEELFAMSLEQELSFLAPRELREALAGEHCSDYMLCSASSCVDGHNEDGRRRDGALFVARVRLGAENFTALNYAGDLLGGMSAFAFNAAGLAFSLNWVGPNRSEVGGLGRNFVSRRLLAAGSWRQAVAVIGQRHAAGHNYQLMDFGARRIANFEVAGEEVACREAGAEAFFHANSYETLEVPGQEVKESTKRRLARAARLPRPSSGEEVLKVLGDQGDREYPIFHDERSHARGDLSDWTLATVLFDLDKGEIRLLRGNPAALSVLRTFAVPRTNNASLLLV